MPKCFFLILIFFLFIQPGEAQEDSIRSYFTWDEYGKLPAFGEQQEQLGVAGPIAGVNKEALIVAGGANFSTPVWENPKEWHDDIWVGLTGEYGEIEWMYAGKLDHPLAYPAVVSSSLGVIAMGGCNEKGTFNEVLLLRWDAQKQELEKSYLPSLPQKCAYGSAALIDNTVYLAGGTEELELATAMNNFWRLDLDQYGSENFRWEVLPAWPGPARAFNLTVAQQWLYECGLRDQRQKNSIKGRRMGGTAGCVRV